MDKFLFIVLFVVTSLGIAFIKIKEYYLYKICTKSAYAKVISIKSSYGNNKKIASAVLTYKVDENFINVKNSLDLNSEMIKKDDVIEILYNPRKPGQNVCFKRELQTSRMFLNFPIWVLTLIALIVSFII